MKKRIITSTGNCKPHRSEQLRTDVSFGVLSAAVRAALKGIGGCTAISLTSCVFAAYQTKGIST